jgi:hypothetical protein
MWEHRARFFCGRKNRIFTKAAHRVTSDHTGEHILVVSKTHTRALKKKFELVV